MAAKSSEDVELIFLPEKLRDKLMPFQKEGVKFAIKKNGRVLMGDEMGLGKTLQALSAAYYFRDLWPLLIIVPSSLRYPWIEEIEKWLPEIDPRHINLVQSGADIHELSSSEISVVTYGLLRCPSSRLLQEALINQEFKVIIVDESHYIKNRRSATSKFLVPLLQQATHKMLLTGTPALARPEELFPQLDALCPGKFGNWSTFAKRYCNAHWQYFGRQRRTWNTQGASNLYELQSFMSQYVMIRRLKKDVLTQLPPKQRQKVPFVVKDSELKKDLDRTWSELEQAMRGKQTNLNEVLQGAEMETFQIHALMSALYKKTAVVKLGPVKEYVRMLCENQGLKFLVFAYHHAMMDAIQEELHDSKVNFIRIDGNTPNQDRPLLVHKFQVDKNTRVAILSIKAAGVGLTLTAARLVVFAELDWTPGTLEQCEDRAHRIGQQQAVHVHYLVARGTLDDWVWSALARKTTVVTATLNGKRQVLSMEHGNKGLTDCLSAADAWKPSAKTQPSEDLLEYFTAAAVPSNQKKVLDYFSSKDCKRKESDSPGQRSSPRKRQKKTSVACDSVIVLDSDEDSTSRGQCLDVHLAAGLEDQAADFKPLKKKLRRAAVVMSEGEDAAQPSTSTPQRSAQLWSCQVCTFHNHQAISACEMCDSPKNVRSSGGQRTALSSQKELWDLSATPTVTKGHRAQADIMADIHMDTDSTSKTPPGSGQKKSLKHGQDKHKRTKIFKQEGSDLHDQCGSSASPNEASPVDCVSRAAGLPAASHGDGALPGPASKVTADEDSWDPFQASPLTSAAEQHASPQLRHSFNLASHVSTTDAIGQETSTDLPDCGTPASSQTSSQCLSEPVDNASFLLHSELDSDSDSNTLPLAGSPRSLPASPLHPSASPSPEEQPTCGAATSDSLQDTISPAAAVELEAAADLLAPASRPYSGMPDWRCPACNTNNDGDDEDCDGCFKPRPDDCSQIHKAKDGQAETEKNNASTPEPSCRQVDLDKVPTYELLCYCCSRNTSRIYLYDPERQPLYVNFIPLDIECENYSALPDLLLHPHNLRHVRRFVREWNSLAPTKQRIIGRSGAIFVSPSLIYEELKGQQKTSTQRYTSKADGAALAMSKAEEMGGSIRVITRPPMASKKSKVGSMNKFVKASPQTSDGKKRESQSSLPSGGKPTKHKSAGSSRVLDLDDLCDVDWEKINGIIQAVSPGGRPLCLQCHKPYQSPLVENSTVAKHAWATRFCGRNCAEKYWMCHHRDYSKQQVYEAEHGVCQLCGVDAQSFFDRIRITKDTKKRATLLQDSVFGKLSAEVKQRMVSQPTKGMFWQVDHITPVSEGGGECDIDNLRTLCTPCHRQVTAQQTRARAQDKVKQKRIRSAANTLDITAFFQPK